MKFYEISKNTFLQKTPLVAASLHLVFIGQILLKHMPQVIQQKDDEDVTFP